MRFSFTGRSQPQAGIEAPPDPIFNGETTDNGEAIHHPTEEKSHFNAFEFVESQAALFDRSCEQWEAIGETARELKDREIGEAVQSIFGGYTKNGTQSDFSYQNAKIITRQLPPYVLWSARYASTLPDREKVELLSFEDDEFDFLVKQPDFPRTKLRSIYARLSSGMAVADSIGGQVLDNLFGSIQSPDDLSELAGFFELDAGDANADRLELQNIIRADWHKPNQRQSKLRTYLEDLREQPDILLDDFTNAILEPGNNKLRCAVLDMARFAIISEDEGEITDEGIRRVLSSSRNRWSEVNNAEEAFRLFVDEKITELESTIHKIALVRNDIDIRIPPRKSEVESLGRKFRILTPRDDGSLPGSRKAGKRARRNGTVKGNGTGSADIVDTVIEQTAAPAETRRRDRIDLPSDLPPKKIINSLTSLGLELVPGGGKGGHQKILNPNTKRSANVHEDMRPNVLLDRLKELGVDPSDFRDNL